MAHTFSSDDVRLPVDESGARPGLCAWLDSGGVDLPVDTDRLLAADLTGIRGRRGGGRGEQGEVAWCQGERVRMCMGGQVVCTCVGGAASKGMACIDSTPWMRGWCVGCQWVSVVGGAGHTETIRTSPHTACSTPILLPFHAPTRESLLVPLRLGSRLESQHCMLCW